MSKIKMVACDYAAGAPKGYRCGQCKAHGVKLWREYQTFLDHQALFCADCAEKRYRESHKPGEQSSWAEGSGDTVGWLVPAVPTAEGDTFWGYSSVPQPGVRWWHRLPPQSKRQRWALLDLWLAKGLKAMLDDIQSGRARLLVTDDAQGPSGKELEWMLKDALHALKDAEPTEVTP